MSVIPSSKRSAQLLLPIVKIEWQYFTNSSHSHNTHDINTYTITKYTHTRYTLTYEKYNIENTIMKTQDTDTYEGHTHSSIQTHKQVNTLQSQTLQHIHRFFYTGKWKAKNVKTISFIRPTESIKQFGRFRVRETEDLIRSNINLNNILKFLT